MINVKKRMKKNIICLIGILLLTLGFTTNDNIVNYDKLWSEINMAGVKFPDIVFAQALLESGHFKSAVFRKNNNLFGMKYPKVRETIATGSNLGYATFTNWKASVMDYKLWQDMFIKKRNITSRDEYLNHLDKIYSKTNGYSAMLKKIMKNFSYLS